ncbi:MAG TPA: nucleoside triphosphate pyrophosphohydrolase family protein [Saprospiraceae bacterium]|nr:nucleoside triphosphate pyrophosphohydrolase family protein [Saprospiraceae bacterium]
MKTNFPEANALNDVAAFHQLFKLPVLNQAQIPDQARVQLRLNLLKEELRELEEAVEAQDLVAAADAFCDLQYVLSGAILEFGLADQFKNLFDHVQASNMSKACSSLEEAEQSIDWYKTNKSEDAYAEFSDGKYLVYRKSDKKVLKSIRYQEANLAKVIKL